MTGPDVVRSTRLAAPAETVWRHATTAEGINDELRPLLGMRMPRGVDRLSPDTVRPGTRLGRAWLLAGGVLPVEYDDITVTAIEPGRFREDSSMMLLAHWRHERSVQRAGTSGCVVEDRLTFTPRRPLLWARPVVRRVVGALFDHRHRRLVRRFGAGG